MRVILCLTAAVGLAWIVAPVIAQSGDPNADACFKKSGDEAIAACTAAIQSGKFDTKTLAIMFYDRGIEYDGRKDYIHAMADHNEAIRLDPQLAIAFRARGLVYSHQKNYVRGIADYGEAIRLNPQYAEAYNSRCWSRVAYLNKELNLARKDCDAAVRLSPNNPHFLDSRGLVALKQKRFADAWNDYDKAANLSAQASYIYGRGMAAIGLGRTAQGLADLKKAQTLDPKVRGTYAAYGIRPK